MLVEVNPAPPGDGEASCESSEYISTPRLICRRLLVQTVRCALRLAALIAGNSKAARIAMTTITTSISTNVNPPAAFVLFFMLVWTTQWVASHAA